MLRAPSPAAAFTTLLLDTLERLANREVRSIRIPVESYSPQYKAYFENSGSALNLIARSRLCSLALQPTACANWSPER